MDGLVCMKFTAGARGEAGRAPREVVWSWTGLGWRAWGWVGYVREAGEGDGKVGRDVCYTSMIMILRI